jgi:hypothetical protein
LLLLFSLILIRRNGFHCTITLYPLLRYFFSYMRGQGRLRQAIQEVAEAGCTSAQLQHQSGRRAQCKGGLRIVAAKESWRPTLATCSSCIKMKISPLRDSSYRRRASTMAAVSLNTRNSVNLPSRRDHKCTNSISYGRPVSLAFPL